MRSFAKLLLSGLLCLFLSPVSAQGKDEQEILSETVKIISYKLTDNHHVLEKALASATFISADGLLLTNHHVVTDEDDLDYDVFAICVVQSEEKKPKCLYTASLIAKDKSLDAALLQVDPQDIFGAPVPVFPFLSTGDPELPETGEKITVVGFPGVGGETITETEGQVSGYDEKEGIRQLKTDATISSGNSGGTAKTTTGRFIGVPSYLRSLYGTIGYIIPLAEIEPWLDGVLDSPPMRNELAIDLLREHQRKWNETEESRRFESGLFPYYRIDIPEPWKVDFLNETGIILSNTVQGYPLEVTIETAVSPYPLKDDFMDFVVRKIEKNQHRYLNYHREAADFFGIDGQMIRFDYDTVRVSLFLGAIENVFFSTTYSISLENPQETQQAIDKLFSTFVLGDGANNTARMQTEYRQQHPDVSLSTSAPFYVAPVYDSSYEDLIVTIENPDSYEQNFEISEHRLSKDFWELRPDEIMEKELKTIGNKLLTSSGDVVVDGLPGFSYTYSYKGDDFNQTRKKTVVKVFKGIDYFQFVYDDLSENHDRNIGYAKEVLRSFRYNGEGNPGVRGEYSIPSFRLLFGDIRHHKYENKINSLAAKEIFTYGTPYFFPEVRVSRIDALKAVVESKLFVEAGRNLQELSDEFDAASAEPVFRDVSGRENIRVVNLAADRGIITPRERFFPQSGLTLAEAMVMLCKTYELPVWDPPYRKADEWYLPYVLKGEDLGVIPDGLAPFDTLTRGQFASLLYDFVRIVGERSDL